MDGEGVWFHGVRSLGSGIGSALHYRATHTLPSIEHLLQELSELVS